MRRLSRGKKHEFIGAFDVCAVSGVYAGYRHMVFRAQQGRRGEGLLPRRAQDGRMGVRPFGGRERHERVGADGASRFHLYLRYGADLDRHRAFPRLYAQLDFHRAAASLVLDRVRRFDHDPAVSHQPLRGAFPCPADHQRHHLPCGIYRVFRKQHQGVRHAL